MKQVEIIDDMTTGAIRSQELIFADGRIFQREISGLGVTRFIDVTEEIARAIDKYIRQD